MSIWDKNKTEHVQTSKPLAQNTTLFMESVDTSLSIHRFSTVKTVSTWNQWILNKSRLIEHP